MTWPEWSIHIVLGTSETLQVEARHMLYVKARTKEEAERKGTAQARQRGLRGLVYATRTATQ